MRFHTKYQQFDPDLLVKSKEFFESGPWSGTRAEKRDRFQKWWDDACALLGYESSYVVHIAEAADAFRIPPGAHNVVQLHALSVLELFHQFRHEMHLRTGEFGMQTPEGCQDAHGWACSLYYCSRPTTFCNSVLKGKIPGVSEVDLIEMDDAGCALQPAQRAEFERLTDDLIEDLSEDPEFAELLDQFNGEG